MIELTVEADVPESRQVTITLPPKVPTGRVSLSVGVVTPRTGPLPRFRALDADPMPEDGYRFGLLFVEEIPGPHLRK